METTQNIYTGKFDNTDWYQVWLNGEPFDHLPSLSISNHSPDGFSWGYNGSGPAQLALAILLLETDEETAKKNYMYFKDQVIGNPACLPVQGNFKLTSDDVQKWLKDNGR